MFPYVSGRMVAEVLCFPTCFHMVARKYTFVQRVAMLTLVEVAMLLPDLAVVHMKMIRRKMRICSVNGVSVAS